MDREISARERTVVGKGDTHCGFWRKPKGLLLDLGEKAGQATVSGRRDTDRDITSHHLWLWFINGDEDEDEDEDGVVSFIARRERSKKETGIRST